MDDAKRIVDWFIERKRELDFKIIEYEWCNIFLNGYYDFSCEFKFNQKKYLGRGTDCDRTIALIKAISEAYERFLVTYNGLLNSNGVAVHTDLNCARRAAKFELVERDGFFCHFLTQKPFFFLNSEIVDKKIIQSVKIFNQNQVKISFFKMSAAVSNVQNILCVASGLRHKNMFGCILGLGSSADVRKSLESAYIECVRSAATIVQNSKPVESLSESDFLKLKTHNIYDHIKLGLNPDYYSTAQKLFAPNSDYNNSKLQKISEFRYFELKSDSYFADLGLKGVKAVNDCLQDLFFGKTEPSKLNKIRLINFSENHAIDQNYNKSPHPLG